jgi:hypothetical protein
MPNTPSRIHSDEEPSNRDIMDAVLRLDARTARVEHLLNGSSNPANGLVVRVDRLEQDRNQQREKASAWYVAVVGALVTGLGSAAWLVIQAVQIKQASH